MIPSLGELREIVEIAIDSDIAIWELDTNLYSELGMDSIGAVAMVVEIQRRFGIRIPDEEISKLQTPRLILEHLQSTISGQGVAHDVG
jgi:acyl carrier protein